MKECIIRYKIWLRWWLLFVLIALGSTVLYLSEILYKINQADITRISFLIYAVFGYFSVRTGMDTYLTCKHTARWINSQENRLENLVIKHIETGWFAANILLTLGMIGSVIGFIYMLTTCFVDIEPGNIESMRELLAEMSVGMGTALYTTAAGLICSLLLKLQLFNLDSEMQNKK